MINKRLSAGYLPLLIVLVIFTLVSCKDEEPRKTLEFEEPLPLETEETGYGWKTDESGIFSYYEYIPTDGSVPIIDLDYSKSDNIIVFGNSEEDERYGYMDMEFNVLMGALNTVPEPFINGLCYFSSQTMQGIYDLDFEKVEMQFGRMAVIGTDVFFCDSRLLGGTGNSVLKDIDPDTFLVPVKSTDVYEISDRYKVMLTGFKTLSEYMDPTGEESENFQIPPLYIVQNGFREGMAAVAKYTDGKFKMGFINETGELAVNYKYDVVYDFCGGYATAFIINDSGSRNISSCYIIDKEGNEMGPYIQCDVFRNGFCAVYESRGAATFITQSGERISDKYYDSVEPFNEGFAAVRKGMYQTYINELGQEITDRELYQGKEFSDGKAAVSDNSGYFGYIDESGDFVITPKYRSANSFSSGFAYVRMKHGEEGFLIDESENQYLKELGLSQISKFNANGYAVAKAAYISDGSYKYKYYSIRINP